MSERVIALAPQKAMALLTELKEHVENLAKYNQLWCGDFIAASDKCSPAMWIEDVKKIGENIDSRASGAISDCDEMIEAMRRFISDFQEVSDTRIGCDI